MNRRRRRRRKRTAPTLAPAKKFVYSCAACRGAGPKKRPKAQRPARGLGPKRPSGRRAGEQRSQRPNKRDSRRRPPPRRPNRNTAPILRPSPADQRRAAKGAPAAAAPWPSEPTQPAAASPSRAPKRAATRATRPHQRNFINATQNRQNAKPNAAAAPSDARQTGRRRNCGMPKAQAQCARRASPAPRLRQEWVGLSGGPRIVGLRDSPDGASRGGKAPSFPRRQNQERAPRKKSPKLSFHGARPWARRAMRRAPTGAQPVGMRGLAVT